VSIVTGPDAEPREVHVLASSGKPPKQVVRDIQSLAMASYGLALDHRIVSVVQLDDAPDAAGVTSLSHESAPTQRPSLTSITVHTRDGEAEVTVALTIDGRVFTGTATGRPADPAEVEAVAGAHGVEHVGHQQMQRVGVEFGHALGDAQQAFVAHFQNFTHCH
jgi:hypothetical protein